MYKRQSYKPAVAPAGAIKPLFGTNPISFAWPRPGKTPVVYDMATASMAMGEVQVAKREGHKVPLGTGLTKDGKETTDPGEIADGGVLLPFGGYKGSAIAMMVELLAGALVGDNFSYETAAKDNNDGGPPSGGEFILAINNSHHMAAMWPETEKLAEEGLVAFACTSYKPAVAPAGAIKPLFGTNPISFAWPRPGKTPVVYDMATASMAMGEVQVAKREGHKVPLGTGLTKDGKETTDPGEIADGGVLLPFGGYKGSAIAMMVELMAGALVGDNFSFETAAKDNNDGGPPSGGEFILAINPDKTSGTNWQKHAEEFFEKMKSMGEVRLPGERRHKNRMDTGPRNINEELVNKIKSLS